MDPWILRILKIHGFWDILRILRIFKIHGSSKYPKNSMPSLGVHYVCPGAIPGGYSGYPDALSDEFFFVVCLSGRLA